MTPFLATSNDYKQLSGHEDRCLFTGDGDEYYLVFLGHTTDTETTRAPMHQQYQTHIREQSITPDDMMPDYHEPVAARLGGGAGDAALGAGGSRVRASMSV